MSCQKFPLKWVRVSLSFCSHPRCLCLVSGSHTSYLDFYRNFFTVPFTRPLELRSWTPDLMHHYLGMPLPSAPVLYNIKPVMSASLLYGIPRGPNTTPSNRVKPHVTQGRSRLLPQMLLACCPCVHNPHSIPAVRTPRFQFCSWYFAFNFWPWLLVPDFPIILSQISLWSLWIAPLTEPCTTSNSSP